MSVYEAVQGASTIPGWYPEDQLKVLYLLALSSLEQGDTAVEVGTWLGRSAYALAYAATMVDGTLVCVDTWLGIPEDPENINYAIAKKTDPLAEARRNLAFFGDHVQFEVGDSKVVLPFFPSESTGLVHIDGDHLMPTVGLDIKEGWRLLRPGGILCGDDYDEVDVQKGVAQLGIKPEVFKDRLWWVVKFNK